MFQVSQEKDNYLLDFELFEKKSAAKQPSWIHQIRKGAISRFSELGFPTTREEEWRFTNVAPLVKIPFRSVSEYAPDGLTKQHIDRFAFGGRNRLVFVNGLYSTELSSLSHLPDGVRVENLAKAMITNPDGAEQHLARHAVYDSNAFTALNTAFLCEGAFVYVPNGKVIEEPIHLLFVSTSRETGTVSHPRNLILVGRGSMATIIESYVCLYNSTYFTNAVTEVVAGEGAAVDHYKMQEESENAFHIATTQVHQDRNSTFSSHSIAVGAELARNNLNVLLNAEGSECALNGLYFVAGRQHIDNHTAIDHAKPHCTSHELYKGILDGKSKAVFNGKIIVRKDAQKTDAKQTNKNLVLSDDAQVNTTPQLEILADDVKCTHGATVGQLDEEAVFYLKSRGINQETARSFLTYGFASDVIRRIKVEPVRARLNTLISTKLQKHS